jgi:hypothetical protein
MGNSKDNNLCDTLTALAQWTNQTIAKGHLTGLGILEETVTDYLLNEIAALHPQSVYTKKFSRKQEGRESGADWLWCIGNPGTWLPILVQAKIVNPKTKQCHYLDYKTKHGKQSQLLLKYARTHRFLPLYCIYSLIDQTTILEARKVRSLSNLGRANWACSFIIPKYIQQLIKQNRKSQHDLLKYGVPWMYPFCDGSEEAEIDLAHVASHSLFRIYNEFTERDNDFSNKVSFDRLEDKSITKKQSANLRIQWAKVDPTRLIIPKIPRAIVRLLTSPIKPSESPISSISIISSRPIEEVFEVEGIEAKIENSLGE